MKVIQIEISIFFSTDIGIIVYNLNNLKIDYINDEKEFEDKFNHSYIKII